jgi:hypothetical protein
MLTNDEIIKIQSNTNMDVCPFCGSKDMIDEGCCLDCWETKILPDK